MDRSPLLRPADRSLTTRGQAAWLLVTGLALVGLGLVLGAQTGQSPTAPEPGMVSTTSFGTADSNGSMIAVTGHDVTGGSLLYLIDTENKQLAVYTAQGGAPTTSEVRFVGARRIDLDLEVNGYNDKSEYSWKELDERFKKASDPKVQRKNQRDGGPQIPEQPRAGG